MSSAEEDGGSCGDSVADGAPEVVGATEDGETSSDVATGSEVPCVDVVVSVACVQAPNKAANTAVVKASLRGWRIVRGNLKNGSYLL